MSDRSSHASQSRFAVPWRSCVIASVIDVWTATSRECLTRDSQTSYAFQLYGASATFRAGLAARSARTASAVAFTLSAQLIGDPSTWPASRTAFGLDGRGQVARRNQLSGGDALVEQTPGPCEFDVGNVGVGREVSFEVGGSAGAVVAARLWSHADAAMTFESSGELRDYHAMTARSEKPSLRHPGWLDAPRHVPGRYAGEQPG